MAPANYEQIFESRLIEVLKLVLKTPVSPAWEDEIERHDHDEWVAGIVKGTPDLLKRILASDRVIWEDKLSLPSQATNLPGLS
jgi:hypothetical protein